MWTLFKYHMFSTLILQSCWHGCSNAEGNWAPGQLLTYLRCSISLRTCPPGQRATFEAIAGKRLLRCCCCCYSCCLWKVRQQQQQQQKQEGENRCQAGKAVVPRFCPARAADNWHFLTPCLSYTVYKVQLKISSTSIYRFLGELKYLQQF